MHASDVYTDISRVHVTNLIFQLTQISYLYQSEMSNKVLRTNTPRDTNNNTGVLVSHKAHQPLCFYRRACMTILGWQTAQGAEEPGTGAYCSTPRAQGAPPSTVTGNTGSAKNKLGRPEAFWAKLQVERRPPLSSRAYLLWWGGGERRK